jgi:hypothetical protein
MGEQYLHFLTIPEAPGPESSFFPSDQRHHTTQPQAKPPKLAMFNTSTTTAADQLLAQVSMFANAVSRLTQKKQAKGELTRGEQGLLEANTHLLRQRVLQLHGLPFQPFQQLPTTTTSSSHHMTVPLKKRPMLKQTAANVDSAASLQQPCPSAGGVPPRRRTKRMFDRACQHCGTRFTSQWRTGPSGPSTYATAPPPPQPCGSSRNYKHF